MESHFFCRRFNLSLIPKHPDDFPLLMGTTIGNLCAYITIYNYIYLDLHACERLSLPFHLLIFRRWSPNYSELKMPESGPFA